MRIFIQPCELLLLRTGHPFNAGENHYAETLFPPTPETWQGALRATIASHWNPDKSLAEVFQEPELVALIGNQEHYGRFTITGIAPGRRKKNAPSSVERLFPVPAHLLVEESGENQPVRLRPYPKDVEVASNLPDTMQLLYPDQPVQGKLEPLRGWLTEQSLLKVLRGQEAIERSEVIDPTTIFIYELRQGIGIHNQSKTTAEGQFYQARMIRMNHRSDDPFLYGFVVDIRLLQTTSQDQGTTVPGQFVADELTQRLLRLPGQGWMILGGERRAAHFEVISPPADAPATLEQQPAGNLLYLATPAAFTHGWQPQPWPVPEPIAVAIERYQPIGGWQLSPERNAGRSKTLRSCVPAGSIYFFKSTVPKIHPFTDYGGQIGYGITYSGDYTQ